MKKTLEVAKQWWKGYRLADVPSLRGEYTNNLPWQIGILKTDMEDSIDHVHPEKENFKDNFAEKFMTAGSKTGQLFSQLFSGRRLVSSLFCTFVVPTLPLEILCRYLIAGADTLYAKAAQQYDDKRSLFSGTAKLCCGALKVVGKITEVLIANPLQAFRNLVDSTLFSVIPIVPAYHAYKQYQLAKKHPDQNPAKEAVNQFRKSWLWGCWCAVKGALTATRPIAILGSAGALAPACAALSMISPLTHIPSAGIGATASNAISTVTNTAATTASFVPSKVPSLTAVPQITSTGQRIIVQQVKKKSNEKFGSFFQPAPQREQPAEQHQNHQNPELPRSLSMSMGG